MKTALLSKHTVLAAAVLSLGTSFVASAAAGSGPAVGTLVLASSDAKGQIKPGLTSPCAISADGSLVAFTSSASEFVAGDTNNSNDVFLKNVRTGTITRVSTTSTGGQIFDGATCLGMTPDGNSIVLRASTPSSGGGTVFPAGPREPALFVNRLQSGSLERVSPPMGTLPETRSYEYRSISDDGNTVAFVTNPSARYGGPYSYIPTGPGRTLIRDLRTGTLTDLTSTITLDLGALPPDTISTMALSPDGSLLAFDSRADHPAAGDTNGKSDVFVLDLTTRNLQIVSTDSSGQQIDGFSGVSPKLAVSRFLAGGAKLAIYVPTQSSFGAGGLYIKNLNDESLRLVLAQEPGIYLNDEALSVSFSRDGSKVAFTRQVLTQEGIRDKAVVRDVLTGQERIVAVTAAGVIGNNQSRFPFLSQNGTNVLFESNASNLSRARYTHELYVKTISP